MPKFAVTRVVVDELPPEQAVASEEEIRNLLRPLEGASDDELGLACDVELTVLLASEMGPHVDRVSQEYGVWSGRSYGSQRMTVQAMGITIAADVRNPMKVTIVMNQEPWKAESGNVALRVYLLTHEVAHVMQMAALDEEEWAKSRREEPTHMDFVRREARILWNEADADLRAEDVCRSKVRNGQGQPVGAAEFMLNDLGGCAAQLLGEMCAFMERDVEAYRNRLAPLESLHPRAVVLLRELYRVLAHAVAIAEAAKFGESLTNALRGVRGFSAIVGPDWDGFQEALLDQSITDGAPRLEAIWKATLGRMGLEVTDLEDGGMYVGVAEPVRCSECARSESGQAPDFHGESAGSET